MSVPPWSVMYYPILRPDHAKICFPWKQNVSRKSLVFVQYFRSRMDLHSSKTNSTLGSTNHTGLLRPLHNSLRGNHLGHFEYMSTYLFRSHFKTSQTVGQWHWWLEVSHGISFLAGRDGDGSGHGSSPAWDPVSCSMESAHLLECHGRGRGTPWDTERLGMGCHCWSNSSSQRPTLHPALRSPWESRK